ncbi:helix-turn-helix domain-containing protein [Methyloradius palustris]|uniref:HigA2-like helix-turn-helix domain-containing protein n=1 Tax=Methyloradius palustris TaxID=2778876 RepID=A0A8D5GCI2_9PROT|nr:helix-turn-helix transcriptional regulator [Methyloradius palustris]BCM24948.1 hypothetical protein ZMTM_12070 [Methyloradius palustris]
MIEIEEGSKNVYADLGMADAGDMILKAQLVTKIGELIERRKWSKPQVADALDIPQSELSHILCGHFRSMSKAKMLDYLTKLEET